MPAWDRHEAEQAAEIARAIEASSVPARRPHSAGDIHIRLSESLLLKAGMASTARALPVRLLWRKLGFDEDHAFRWRLEHKLVQAHIIHRYLPGLIPVTRGLGGLARQYGRQTLREGLKTEFPRGQFIKPAMGDSSGERPQKDDTCHYLAAIEEHRQTFPDTDIVTDENTVAQDRLFIEKEYRVHTLENEVIEDLTFLRYGRGNLPVGEREIPNAFMRSALAALPSAFLGHSMIGWDIAMDARGKMTLIESNFSGCHPVHRRGFQCSGYFQDFEWGASLTARLFRHIEKIDGINVHVETDVEGIPERAFHANVARWLGLLRSGEAK